MHWSKDAWTYALVKGHWCVIISSHMYTCKWWDGLKPPQITEVLALVTLCASTCTWKPVPTKGFGSSIVNHVWVGIELMNFFNKWLITHQQQLETRFKEIIATFFIDKVTNFTLCTSKYRYNLCYKLSCNLGGAHRPLRLECCMQRTWWGIGDNLDLWWNWLSLTFILCCWDSFISSVPAGNLA